MAERKADQVNGTEGTADDALGKAIQDRLQKILEADELLRQKEEETEEFINERKDSINRGARRSPRRFSI